MPAEKALQKWKVVELRTELTRLGLETKGVKAVLIKRLTEAREAAAAAPAEEVEEKVEEPAAEEAAAPVEAPAEPEAETDVKAAAETKEAE